MKIFLTGASGFIGSWVLKTLLKEGHQITALVRRASKIPSLQTLKQVQLVEADMHDFETIQQHLPGHEACIHIALGWGDTPLEMLENDTKVTMLLLQESARLKFRHFLFTSSTAALGETQKSMTTSAPNRPLDLYGATKAAAEAFILGYAKQTDMLCNIIRPGYTFGNPAFPDGVTQPDQRFHNIVLHARRNEDIRLTQHDGTQFIWAGDLATLYLQVLNSQQTRQIFHGLSQEFTTWESIAQEALQMTHSSSRILLEDQGWGEKPHLFDVSSMQKAFGLSFHSRKQITAHLQFLRENPFD